MRRLDESSRTSSHYFLGMPLTDVAATLGIPLGTVKSRLHRALREMQSRSRPNPVVAVAGTGRAGGMTASTRYERNLPGILDDLSAGPARVSR